MSLSQLPPEVLLHVLGCLGSEFFASDIRRLTIFRSWYNLAWTVLVRDLHFTTRSLRLFTENKAALKRSHPYIVTVELFLGVGDEPSQSRSTGGLRDTSNASPAQLDYSLTKLAASLSGCSGLRYLKVQGRGQSSNLCLDSEARLNAAPLATLISIPHLTTLEFDTAGCHLESPSQNRVHFCQQINSLLPHLRRLRCRMEEICEVLLRCPTGDTALEEIIINLSISQLSNTVTSYRYPNRCQTVARNFPRLRLALHDQAVTLTTLMKNPRIVRVISHELPSCDIYAFDAIKEKQTRLENNIDWDADGEPVGEMFEGNGEDSDEYDLFESDSSIVS